MEDPRDLARLEEEHAVVRSEARDPVLDEVRDVPGHPTRARHSAGRREPEVASGCGPRRRAVTIVPGHSRGRGDPGYAEARVEHPCAAPGRPVEEPLRVVDVVSPGTPVVVQPARP